VKPPFLPQYAHGEPHRPTIKARVARLLGRTWARVGYARHVEPTWLEMNRISLPVRGLSPGFHDLKIAHLTDFHAGEHIPAGYLEAALERTQAEQPDAIALTGDFIDRGPRHVERAARLFRGLKAPLGVFAVLGNHDFSVHNVRGVRRYPGLDKAIADALRAEGVTVLRNKAMRFERDGASLLVAGIDDLWSRESDPHTTFRDQCPETPRVVLAHNPQSVEEFGKHRADLVLSGHTHGGQIDWPGLGRVLLGKKAKRWAAGLYEHNGGHVYVNKGVGFGWRFRFGVRPEVAIFTLKPA
jgi:uncharacterized protein